MTYNVLMGTLNPTHSLALLWNGGNYLVTSTTASEHWSWYCLSDIWCLRHTQIMDLAFHCCALLKQF